MLSRFRQWLADSRATREAHDRAWTDFVRPESDNLSKLQLAASAALQDAVPGIKLERAGLNETYLTGDIPGTSAKVFIYYGQAEVYGGPELFPGEYQDYDSPEELIRDFVSTAIRAAAV